LVKGGNRVDDRPDFPRREKLADFSELPAVGMHEKNEYGFRGFGIAGSAENTSTALREERLTKSAWGGR
jgi:hypothetical protein